MLNIIELEQRWLRYKIKSFIPHIVIVISLLIITLVLLSLSSSTTDNKQEIVEPTITPSNKEVIKKEPIEKIVPVKKTVSEETIVVIPVEAVPQKKQAIQKESQKVKLSPSLDFMRKMQNSVQPFYNNTTPSDNYETDVPRSTKKINTRQAKVLETQAVESTPKQSEKRIQIKRQNTQNDIYDIIKRFKKNNNPALSLFVAKKYYELGNYRQAYNYALMTNKLNNEIESSWIIFSKSLVKLGKKDKAIKTLKKYIKHSHSTTAEILLDEIQSGKFR